MENVESRVRLIALDVAVGINQLIYRCYLENIDIITDKIFKGELVQYITNKYKDENIEEFYFSEISKNNLPTFNQPLSDYEALASSVLSNILYKEK